MRKFYHWQGNNHAQQLCTVPANSTCIYSVSRFCTGPAESRIDAAYQVLSKFEGCCLAKHTMLSVSTAHLRAVTKLVTRLTLVCIRALESETCKYPTCLSQVCCVHAIFTNDKGWYERMFHGAASPDQEPRLNFSTLAASAVGFRVWCIFLRRVVGLLAMLAAKTILAMFLLDKCFPRFYSNILCRYYNQVLKLSQ